MRVRIPKPRCAWIWIPSLALVACESGSAFPTQENARVGTFDSRAVALAYGRSDGFEALVDSLMTELEEAKREGNQERVEALESWGPKMQERMHLQVFSDAPIDNILEEIAARLPAVATAANVDIIVPRVVFADPSAELVDITRHMIELFAPDETTLEIMAQLRVQAPLEMKCRPEEALEGVWKEVEVAITTADSTWTEEIRQPNLTILTARYYSRLAVRGVESRAPLSQGASDEQLLAAWKPFHATAGTYYSSGPGEITETIIVSKSPNETSEQRVYTSTFELEGDVMYRTFTPGSGREYRVKHVRLN